jgi:hypothetical protein
LALPEAEPVTDSQSARLRAAIQGLLTEAEGQLINCSSEMESVQIENAIKVHIIPTCFELSFDVHMWREAGTITICYTGCCDGNGSEWVETPDRKYVQPSWFPLSERQEEQLRRHGWTGGDNEGPETYWHWNEVEYGDEPEYEPYLVDMLIGTLTEVHGVREFDEISIEMNFVPQVVVILKLQITCHFCFDQFEVDMENHQESTGHKTVIVVCKVCGNLNCLSYEIYDGEIRSLAVSDGNPRNL